MKMLIASILILFASTAISQTIVYNNGATYHVKGTERVLVVPKDTPRTLYTLGETVKLRNPKPSNNAPQEECTPIGELSSGAPMCVEPELSLGG